jgi:hypothetical protein
MSLMGDAAPGDHAARAARWASWRGRPERRRASSRPPVNIAAQDVSFRRSRRNSARWRGLARGQRNLNRRIRRERFHEVRFPLDVSLGGRGGRSSTRDRDARSNRDRVTRWAHSRRRYEARLWREGLAQLSQIIEFSRARQAYGFRWRDRADCASCAPGAPSQRIKG